MSLDTHIQILSNHLKRWWNIPFLYFLLPSMGSPTSLWIISKNSLDLFINWSSCYVCLNIRFTNANFISLILGENPLALSLNILFLFQASTAIDQCCPYMPTNALWVRISCFSPYLHIMLSLSLIVWFRYMSLHANKYHDLKSHVSHPSSITCIHFH